MPLSVKRRGSGIIAFDVVFYSSTALTGITDRALTVAARLTSYPRVRTHFALNADGSFSNVDKITIGPSEIEMTLDRFALVTIGDHRFVAGGVVEPPVTLDSSTFSTFLSGGICLRVNQSEEPL